MKASMIIWEYQKLNIKADAGNGDKAIRTVGVIVNDSGFKKGEPIPSKWRF